MLQETSMLYKLTIIYILHRVEFPLSNSQISNFILENDYTDYFNIQQTLGELIDDEYVKRETLRGKTLYSITDSGLQTLKLLKNELSPALRADVDRYINDNKMQLREELSVMSNIYMTDERHYNAHLYIEEDGVKILELNVSANSADEADRICANWNRASTELYPLIINKLLQ